MPNDTNVQSNNYTLLKLIRTGISPLSAMIGTSAYYGQIISNPILGSINALLFSKKLGLDIWNLNQMPSTKKKILNSSKKILLGLGTIGLVNYAKFTNSSINPNPNPFPDDLLLTTNNDNNLMDWDTYISLNIYGISNLIGGLSELIPNRFEVIRKICNMATGGCLISSGVAMGINNDFNNAYAVPTIIAGASEIIHNLLPMETNHNVEEMQETAFNNETARLINDNRFTINSETASQYYGSDNMSEVPLNHDNASLNWDYNHMSL
ncbi:hypothetical protein [Spiroplasma endosymbiont of Danaus chrysippus]|uniref:hypothetical protein n=1 Tax=Spiroplasma endosymbiont of Danaus chrysippus TaxID=2691041 RepID=UPI00157B19CC|nr:hypothetical protein [Spiroplasma endosymbiont of Danaus chrysippus]